MIYFIPFLFCILHSRYIESIFYICAILSSIIRYSYRKPYGEYMIYSNRLYNLIDFTGGELRFIMSVYILVDTFLNTIFTYGLYYEISLAYFMMLLCFIGGINLLWIINYSYKLPYNGNRWRYYNILKAILDLLITMTILEMSIQI